MKKQLYPVYFVGAGPGDPELITVKGLKLLHEADVVLYTGSLVNPQLLNDCKGETISSASLHLQQIVEIMAKAADEGKKVVRLHTGDPSLFGATMEQMQMLDELGIHYTIIPGVSSAFGAAASLKAELTLPEVSQTVIITRIEGRTPVPDSEQLRKLASHGSTMLIFLSVSMMERVVEELTNGGYSKETPVAVVYKATWKEEQIVRGTLETIAELVEEAAIRKTAIICVGEVFSNSSLHSVSKLYDKSFSHGTRQNE